eukprot:1161181-Pelagomonas_calceolata.AAC.8
MDLMLDALHEALELCGGGQMLGPHGRARAAHVQVGGLYAAVYVECSSRGSVQESCKACKVCSAVWGPYAAPHVEALNRLCAGELEGI